MAARVITKKAPVATKKTPADVPIKRKAKAVHSTPEPVSDVPAPITSFSTPQAVKDRVFYENSINDAAREFARTAETEYINAALAGKSAFIQIED